MNWTLTRAVPALTVCATIAAIGATAAITIAATSSTQTQVLPADDRAARDLSARTVIRRDTYGVPHILAEDDEAAGFGLGYAQAEDHAAEMGRRYLLARGDAARWFGRRFLDNDLAMKRLGNIEGAREALTQHTGEGYRRWLRGFVAGVNLYVEQHRAELPAWMPIVTEADILAFGRRDAVMTALRPPPRRGRGASDDVARGGRLGDDGDGGDERLAKIEGVTHVADGDARSRDQRESAPLESEPREPEPRDSVWTDLATQDEGPGSNALAIAGSRTESGKPILLANPHLRWSALYWEAHVTVPGRFNFYGSLTVGLAALRAGFGERIGYAQTNNAPDLVDHYAVPLDPAQAGHYRFNGRTQPFRQQQIRVEVLGPDGRIESVSRTFTSTDFGPVVRLTATHAIVSRSEALQSWRYHEGFYELLFAHDLDSFQSVMARQLIPQSNFTYADADGNVQYLWNARLPRRTRTDVDYSGEVPGDDDRYFFRDVHPLSDLPRVLNPTGGYVQNANNAPWFATVRDRLDPARYPPYAERRDLALRPQMALIELDRRARFSVDDVRALKFNTRVLLADRVLPDVFAAAERRASTSAAASTPSAAPASASTSTAAAPSASASRSAAASGAVSGAAVGAMSDDLRQGIALLRAWDRQTRAASRGAVLFLTAWNLYEQGRPQTFRERWDETRPFETPAGVADPEAALTAIEKAVATLRERYGTPDVAWGDVNRYRFGDIDLPGDGAPGGFGLYRVLSFDPVPAPDSTEGGRVPAETSAATSAPVETGGNTVAARPRLTGIAGRPGYGTPIAGSGDGWVLLVHFTQPVAAYSVLAYGQTGDAASPHSRDQIALFANQQLRPVWFSEADIRAHTEREYRPGAPDAGVGTAGVQRSDSYVESEPGIRIFVRELVPVASNQRRGGSSQRQRRESAPAGSSRGSSQTPILLVHGGGPGGLASFDLNVPGYSLARDFARAGHPVYVMNVRGWEQSTRPAALDQPASANPPAVTFEEAGRDIGAVVDWIRQRRSGAKVAIVGWASGGHWAGGYVSRKPDGVSRLVLLNTIYGTAGSWPLAAACANGGVTDAYRLADGRTLRQRWDASVPDAAVLRSETNGDGITRIARGDAASGVAQRGNGGRGGGERGDGERGRWRENAVAEAYVERALALDPTSETRSPASVRVPLGYLSESCTLVSGRALWDAAAITVPTLVVRGERDFWSRPEDLTTLQRTLGARTRSRFVTIPGATHHLFLDRPERGRQQFVDETLRFIGAARERAR